MAIMCLKKYKVHGTCTSIDTHENEQNRWKLIAIEVTWVTRKLKKYVFNNFEIYIFNYESG